MKLFKSFIGLIALFALTAFAEPRSGHLTFVRGAANPAVAEISTVQTIADVGGALGGKYFTIYSAGDVAKYTVWIDVDNGDTAPVIADDVLVEIDIAADATADAVASAIQVAVDALADFSAGVVTDTVTITNALKGATTNIAAGTSGFSVGVSTAGVSSADLISSASIGGNLLYWKVCNDVVQTSTYIFVGSGIDPGLSGISLGKGACFVCTDCARAVLSGMKVTSQAASAAYSIIQYRQ